MVDSNSKMFHKRLCHFQNLRNMIIKSTEINLREVLVEFCRGVEYWKSEVLLKYLVTIPAIGDLQKWKLDTDSHRGVNSQMRNRARILILIFNSKDLLPVDIDRFNSLLLLFEVEYLSFWSGLENLLLSYIGKK